LLPILREYDLDGSGTIDYKEFSLILYGNKDVKGIQRKVNPEVLLKK